MLEEDAELGVGVRVDSGLEHGEEDVLQHFAKVGHEVPASEDVARIKRRSQTDRINMCMPASQLI